MKSSPSPGNSIRIRVRHASDTTSFAALVSAISGVDGQVGAVDIVESGRTHIIRDVTVNTTGDAHVKSIEAAVRALVGIEVLAIDDCTFKMHEGGKLDMVSRSPLKDYVDLSMAYTPGVARVCTAIQENPALARDYTIRRSMVAVITDGTAVLGLGNIGAMAALPVMEGKAVLFKEFGGVNSFPICVDTKDPEVLLETARAIAVTFGGINLEDIAAPVCFDIERRLTQLVDIPVFHDDQHGTAVVVGAAFINSVKVTGYKPADITCVVCGAGAAGVACTRALLDLGVGDIIVCDRQGAIFRGRDGLSPSKNWLAENTNRENKSGSLQEVLKGANMFLGLSGPNLLTGDDVRTMAEKPIVFALSNPTPEVPPEAISDYASVIATGRSDYPNQINNVLCFPGLFRGLMESGVKMVTREMMTAAARAIAACVSDAELSPGCVIPSAFNKSVGESVCAAVMNLAADPTAPKTPIYFEF